jgi:glyoxylate reductase
VRQLLGTLPNVARCYVTRELPGGALDRLRGEVDGVDVWGERQPPPRDELLSRVAGVELLLTMLTDRVDDELLDAAPSLRAVANYAVGTDNIDLDACTKRGIPVGNTPDVLTDAYVHGATLGIVGWGRIGQAMAKRASGFDMEVLHHSRSSGVPLDELLARSDFVSLHAPSTPDTRRMIGARELALMKPSALLVNTARGDLVDTDALVAALHDGVISGAALDVTDPEPLPGDHPLLDAPGLTVAPHLGSATGKTRAAMADLAVDNLLAAFHGERMPHCANPDVYDR